MGMTTKTKSRELTIQQATREARRLVDKTIPGVGATVESRGSWDSKTDTMLMITTITFPRNQYGVTGLDLLIAALPGFVSRVRCDSSITVTRKR